jgi:hypothetical protein
MCSEPGKREGTPSLFCFTALSFGLDGCSAWYFDFRAQIAYCFLLFLDFACVDIPAMLKLPLNQIYFFSIFVPLLPPVQRRHLCKV